MKVDDSKMYGIEVFIRIQMIFHTACSIVSGPFSNHEMQLITDADQIIGQRFHYGRGFRGLNRSHIFRDKYCLCCFHDHCAISLEIDVLMLTNVDER